MFPTSVAHQAANGRRARMLIRWLTQQFQVDSIRTLCTCNKTTKQITLGTQFTVGLILDFGCLVVGGARNVNIFVELYGRSTQ